MKLFLIGLMLLMHVIADFTMQGWLANSKQKEWWRKNNPGTPLVPPYYLGDWRPCIIAHAFMWSMMVMLPLFWYVLFYAEATVIQQESFSTILFVMTLINTLIHAVIDHLKCNKKDINLTADQFLHIVQIIATWYVCVAFIPVLQ